MAQDAFPYLLGEVQPGAVALERVHHPQRVLVVAKVAPEALFQAGVEHLLADVPEGRVAEIVAQPDRLDEVLVQPQRPRHGARDRGHLERVSETRAVVVATGRHEDLRLVLQAPEGLAVHDAVAVALEGSAQLAVRLLPRAPGRIGAYCQRREQRLLLRGMARGERGRHCVVAHEGAHRPIVAAAAARAGAQAP